MKALLNLNIAPPGGWRYRDPHTGFEFNRRYHSFDELVGHVRTYLILNKKKEPSHLELTIEDWLCCQSKMEHYCRDATTMPRTLSQYRRGAVAATKALLRGEEAFASQAIAEKRAEICVQCPNNQINRKHSRVGKYTDRHVQKLVGERIVPTQALLFSCIVCSCPLRTKVHFAQDIVDDSLTPEEKVKLPGYCWQINPVKEEEVA